MCIVLLLAHRHHIPPEIPRCVNTHSRPLWAQVEHTGRTPSHLVLSERQLKHEMGTRLRRFLCGGWSPMAMVEVEINPKQRTTGSTSVFSPKARGGPGRDGGHDRIGAT